MTDVPEGIRVTVSFDSPQGCPIAGLSKASNGAVPSSVRPEAAAEDVTEFSLSPAAGDRIDAAPIFSHGEHRRYRVRHDDGECPCRSLGRLGCPVDQYVPEEDGLTLVFYASDHEEARTVIEALRSRYRGMVVRRVEQSPAGDRCREEVLVDRAKLTDRQREVLQTAYEMGYFEYPRRNNATAVAAELGISLSTFGEHLSTAQRKLLADVL